MKKSFLILLLAVVISSVFLLTGCTTAYDTNILAIGSEGTFEYEDLDEVQEDWTLSTDDSYSASDAFDVTDYALDIDTSTTGWAQATQELDVLSNAYYMVEYTYTCTSFTQFSTSTGAEFFFISILEDEDFNTSDAGDDRVYHNTVTVNDKVGSFYFKTENATTATFAINVGTEDHPVSTSSVVIKSIKVVRVHSSEVSSSDLPCFTFESDTYGEVGSFNILYLILGGVGVLLLGYAGYVMFRRDMALNLMDDGYKNAFLKKLRDSKWLGIVLVAAIALIVRVAIDLIITLVAGSKLYMNLGYEVEGQAAQALFMGNYGTSYLISSLSTYTTDFSYVYKAVETSPLYLYTLALCGLIGKNFTSDPLLATTFCVKLVASLADVGTAILIYLLAKKHTGNIGAVVMAATFALIPTTFSISSIWGLSESLLAFSIVFTFFFLLKNNYVGTVICYFVAIMTSWVAIIIAPIIIFYTIMQFMNRKEIRFQVYIAIFASLILFYALNLPFTINSISETPFVCFSNYWDTLWTNMYYTMNAFNFQAILGNNYSLVTTESLIVSIIFMLFIISILAVGYFRSKSRMDLLLMASVMMIMMWTFGNNMEAASMYFALALMLIYAVMNKEKRVYFCFVIFASLMFVNVAYTQLMVSYTLTSASVVTYDTATIYVFSSIELLFTLYFIYVAYDLIATKKALRIQPMTLTYGAWWRNLFLIIKKKYYRLRIKQVKQI
jgi:Gpi18-like mannosyltransferase